jgi:hypothetical protein
VGWCFYFAQDTEKYVSVRYTAEVENGFNGIFGKIYDMQEVIKLHVMWYNIYDGTIQWTTSDLQTWLMKIIILKL